MKRWFSVLLLMVVGLILVHYAVAEDLSAMTDDELLDLRLQINDELASRLEPAEAPEGSSAAKQTE